MYPGDAVQVRRELKPTRLLWRLIGGDTLTEFAPGLTPGGGDEDGISPRGIPFDAVREMGELLQRAGFAMPVTDVDR